MKKSKILAAVAMLTLHNSAYGQWTYNHDATVYNQFLISENGTGSFTPEVYYDLAHRSYKKWARQSNKNALRVDMYFALHPQEAMAQEIDSALSYRARIEEMNVADRTPKALDLAWQSERTKIEKKFLLFRENINKITMYGGTSQDYKEWVEIYNCLQTALKAVRDAYMPLNERKKQYLEIYHDLVLRNQQLVSYVRSLYCDKESSDILHSKVSPRYARLGTYTSEAFGRWKVSMAAGVINNHKQ